MNQQKFRSLDISKYVKPDTAKYIEKWISLHNHDEFVKKVYFTIREINTVIKNYEAPINNHTIFF
jgi:hypothetical protein